MATLSQIGAVTGRKMRPRYTESINAMTPYLPNIYALKNQNQYQDELIDLENQKLEQTERLAAEENDLTRKALKQQKKDARTGTYLTALSTAGELGLGALKYKGLKDIASQVGGGGTGKVDLGTGLAGPIGPDKVVSDVAGGSTREGLLGSISESLGKGATWKGAGVGTIAGNLFGGDDPVKSALIGGGVSAFTSWLSGGDLVDNVIGGILGGIGGAIF